MVGVVMGDEDVMHILEAKSIVMEMERFWKAVQEHWAITPERAAQEAKA